MRSIFKRLDDKSGQIGVFRGPEGLAIAQIRVSAAAEKPTLNFCAFDSDRDADTLVRLARRLPNRKLPATTVLPSDAYHLLLVEAPQVPADELLGAVRWRIKDLIDFHIDDAVIDVFQMPSQSRGGPDQMMYAVVAKATDVRDEVTAAESAGLNLDAIEIVELSLRNIAARLEEDARGVAFLYLGETSGVLLLVRQGILYLTRHIETGVNSLQDADGMRSELVAGLALETRRSLDYFESHYEQQALPVLHTAGLSPSDQDHMSRELGISVRNVDVAALVESASELDEHAQRRCLPAIGAALRQDTVKL